MKKCNNIETNVKIVKILIIKNVKKKVVIIDDVCI